MNNKFREKVVEYLVQYQSQKPFGKWALDSTGTAMPLDMAEFGAKYMLDKVCEWIDGVIYDYIELKHANVDTYIDIHHEKLMEDLRKAMDD